MVSHWDSDLLGRKQDAEFVYNFLVGQVDRRRELGRTGSYVLNIDADWGGGKSFFLRGFAEDLERKGHIVVAVNAWQDDHAQDPYVALMAAIDRSIAPHIRQPGRIKSAWDKAKSSGGRIALRMTGEVAKGLLKKATGVSIDKLGEIVSDDTPDETLSETAVDAAGKAVDAQLERLFDSGLEALIEGFQKTNDAISNFRFRMASVVEAVAAEKPAPIFVLIDELDRCRPTYAVQLLERVKHIFDVEGVVFVFATNSDQLRHSIAGAYGTNFDGFRYLRRFFDRTYVFETATINQFVASLCDEMPKGKINSPQGEIVEVLTNGFVALGSDLRAIKQVMDLMVSTLVAWRHDLPVDVTLLFPLCVNFHVTGKATWPTENDLAALKDWVLVRYSKVSWGNDTKDRSLHLWQIYLTARSLMESMDRIVSHAQKDNNDVNSRYVVSIFSTEWNGRQTDYSKPSIQSELLALVGNAGRIRKNGLQ